LDASTLPLVRPAGVTAAPQHFANRHRQRKDDSSPMSDTTSAPGKGLGLNLPDFGGLGALLRRCDLRSPSGS